MAMQLRRVLQDLHPTPITAVAYNAHKRELYTGSTEPQIKVWDSETGRFNRYLNGHKGTISAILYIYESKALISASMDNSIILWTGKGDILQQVFLSTPVYTLAHNERHNHLLVGGKKIAVVYKINAYNLDLLREPVFEELQKFEHHSDFVRHIVCVESGRFFTIGHDHHAHIYDFEDPKYKRVKTESDMHEAAVTAVAYDGDNNRIISGSFDRTAKMWTTDAFKVVQTFKPFTDAPTGIVHIPATNSIWVAINQNVPIVLDPRTYQNVTEFKYQLDPAQLAELPVETKLLKLFSYPQTGEVLATTDKRHVVMWRFDAHGPYSTLHGHTDWAEVLAHHPAHNGQIVSAGADATIRRWEPPSELYPEQYICQEVVVGHKGAILCAVFTHDGQQLITGSQDTTIKCWAWEQDPDKLESKDTSDRLIRTFTDHTDRVTALAVAEHALISVSWDLTIRFWDLSTWTLAHQINKAHSDFITDISYCAERAEFATSSMDWLVYVWSAPKRSIVAVLRGHTAEVTRVRWNAVLNGWVSVSDDQTVIHWSVDGEVLHRVSLPEESPTALAIDSVLGYAVVGLSDASVVVIDMLAQSELRTIVQRHTGHSDIVKDIIHVHEKNQFVTASWDHTIRVFVAHPRERIKDLALSSATANVSVPSAKQALRRDSEDTVPYAELNPPFVPKTLKFPIPSLPFEAVQTRHEKKEPDSRVKTELAQKLDELEVTLTKLVTDQRRAQQESLQREKAETAKSGGSGFGKAGGDKKRAADLKPKQTARKSQQA